MDEKEILKFWKENKIFEKSLEKESSKGEFVFYDGPPFATGLPHYGSLLASIAKDVFGRYKTMQGYHVRRRWGWDCHGLPIENMIEKRLELKSKKDIEAMGVEKFNETCRSAVLETAGAWKEYIERVGRWVEFDNAYMTMDNSFMESVWWALKQMWDKELIYEGRKVLMYCPRCETPLAKAEVAMDNSYKTVTEDALTVKFKIKSGQKIGDWSTDDNTYMLAWTTTPWTLPGNTALAVNEDVDYCLVKHGKENYILAKDKAASLGLPDSPQHLSEKSSDLAASRRQTFLQDVAASSGSEFKGKNIIGLEYESLYEISAVKSSNKKQHYVVSADFVNTEDGTGIVHIAPIHGEDDYNVGVRYDLPIIPLLDSSGHFNKEAPEFIQGFYLKKGEKYVKEDLEKRGLIFSKQAHTHSYPHCHRCETPLYYSALSSWFINIQKVKNRLVQLNEKINWQPEHLKHGRFLNIVKDAPDWNISRNRYWASPLPIWKCQKCQKVELVGSLEELKSKTSKSGNKYFVMRHGEAKSNVDKLFNSNLENSHKYPLTEKGKEQVIISAEKLAGEKIDLIFYSPFERTKDTAFMVAEKIGLAKENIISDKRLMEVNSGIFDGRPIKEYYAYFSSDLEKFSKAPPGGENFNDIKRRMGEFLYETEAKYQGKNILIISHGYPIWMIRSGALGLDEKKAIEIDEPIKTGQLIEFDFVPLPHNRNFILDLHRPYIDEVDVVCDNCGGEMKRTPEVLDGWFESGAMPFAEQHYPFENKEQFEKRFPGDFVAEYIAQTRTWFYYTHAIASILFGDVGFKNIVSTGTILAEDGSKMSKSKGNYTDPMINMDKFGADALRYYLMASPVMQAEDVKFSDNELKEIHGKIINILWNTFKFYDLYKQEYDGKTAASDSDNALDIWILARLNHLIGDVTDNLEKYDTVKASRPIKDFASDFSTWYVRRSRERVKSTSSADKQFALATMREVLNELSKLIAPVMPFMAEAIYSGVGRGEKESVHLEEWPSLQWDLLDKKLLEEMEEVRKIVSLGLEARAKAGIKVRQPLASLKIKSQISRPQHLSVAMAGAANLKSQEQILKLIKDELNVKEVVFDDKILLGEVDLDTEITPKLKEEGELRDLIRGLQDLRKKAGLNPGQKITLRVQAEIQAREIMEKFVEEIKKSAGIEKLEFNAVVEDGQEISTDSFVIKAKIEA